MPDCPPLLQEDNQMLEPISRYPFFQNRHLEAPLFAERDRFLTHLETLGAGHRELSMKASYLLHIVRILKLDSLHPVTRAQINCAAEKWAADDSPFRIAKHQQGSPVFFRKIATQWFHFLGQLPERPRPAFDGLLEEFCSDMMKFRGLSPRTVQGYRWRISFFLKWLNTERHGNLSALCLKDVDDFLDDLRERRCATATIASNCQAFRTFFAYAEGRQLCPSGLPAGIQSPRISNYTSGHIAPTWIEVQRLLNVVKGRSALDIRARAIILLFVVYGLRSSEVSDLRLSDFDWRQETFGIRRAKRGGIQQYPIQFEVGEAILRYLRHARPSTPSRHLFVGTIRPFAPITEGAMWQIIATRMKQAAVTSNHIGPHALRHACATQLLRKGVSMPDIADFLGHRSTKCIQRYARYDTRRLHKIAAFSLRGVL
jgi:integrase/recombinase XerD